MRCSTPSLSCRLLHWAQYSVVTGLRGATVSQSGLFSDCFFHRRIGSMSGSCSWAVRKSAYLSMSRDSLGVAVVTRTATSAALLSAAALVCSGVVSTSFDSSRSQCLQCCDKQGRRERASALLCFSPYRCWISKLYSCNLWIHLATWPSGFLKLRSHLSAAWSVRTVKWRP